MSTTTATPTTRRSQARMPGLLRLTAARAAIEVKMFFREKETVFFIFLFPLVMMALFSTVFSQEFAPGIKAPRYFLPAMLALGIMLTSFQTTGIAIAEDRADGTLKRLRGTPLPPLAYFAGKIALVASTSLTQMLLLLALGRVAYSVPLPDGEGWRTIGWLWLLGSTAGTLLGIGMGSVLRGAKAANSVITPIVILLPFISGVYFVYSSLPDWLQTVGAVFPLKWMAQSLRSVYLPTLVASEPAGSFELGRAALVIAAWTVAGLILALTRFRWTPSGER